MYLELWYRPAKTVIAWAFFFFLFFHGEMSNGCVMLDENNLCSSCPSLLMCVCVWGRARETEWERERAHPYYWASAMIFMHPTFSFIHNCTQMCEQQHYAHAFRFHFSLLPVFIFCFFTQHHFNGELIEPERTPPTHTNDLETLIVHVNIITIFVS